MLSVLLAVCMGWELLQGIGVCVPLCGSNGWVCEFLAGLDCFRTRPFVRLR
jgi:hypothetical protein